VSYKKRGPTPQELRKKPTSRSDLRTQLFKKKGLEMRSGKSFFGQIPQNCDPFLSGTPKSVRKDSAHLQFNRNFKTQLATLNLEMEES